MRFSLLSQTQNSKIPHCSHLYYSWINFCKKKIEGLKALLYFIHKALHLVLACLTTQGFYKLHVYG